MVAIIQGHPDPGKRFCRALGDVDLQKLRPDT